MPFYRLNRRTVALFATVSEFSPQMPLKEILIDAHRQNGKKVALPPSSTRNQTA
jgi:hypothetical protein